jgi:hypothetical protein
MDGTVSKNLTLLFRYEGILSAYNRYTGVNRGISNEQYREQRDETWIFSVHLSFLQAGTSVIPAVGSLFIYLCNSGLHTQILLLIHDEAKLRGFFSQKFRLLLLQLSPDDNKIDVTDEKKNKQGFGSGWIRNNMSCWIQIQEGF